MTVLLTSLVAVRPFRGYDDPGLPSGYWHFFLSALADASGGGLSVAARFQIAGSPNPSQLYSLETLMINRSGGVGTVNLRFQQQNMDNVPNMGSNGALFHIYTMQVTDQIFGSEQAIFDASRFLPFFMGQPIDNNLSSGFQIDDANNNVGDLAVRAGGYFWGPGSINAPGGPRRPIDGLYAR